MANPNFPLITLSVALEHLPFMKNTDNDFLTPSMYMAQISQIKQFLGVDFYNELVTQVESNTLTALNQYLITYYLAAPLAKFAAADAVRTMPEKFSNVGVMTPNGQSQTASTTERAYHATNFTNDGLELLKLMDEYLRTNKEDYPLYQHNACDKNKLQPNGGGTYFYREIRNRNWRDGRWR